ncbi:VOC family protein [Paracoccus sp. PARArs4]|uniref:VOC family protein n=1 Tax=Paracoccus sp. PARArs4 TaxID=2853442 RepID=UPI0024A64559|nr:VOC family protein [Paracoccus sp. PARArs4]
MTDPRGIARVVLRVRDAGTVGAFYRDAIGLHPMGAGRFGDGRRVLVELIDDPAATPRDPRAAGLFHTAILLPDRADLGAWVTHAARSGLQLTGASDHGVSEAIYLNDPEGNGIEIYRDRPAAEWVRDGDRVEMFTRRLDLTDLARAAHDDWVGVPRGTVVGHVHLQVGDLPAAAGFMTGDLGLTRTFAAGGGEWFGWDGYHHHLAVNTWNSAGAGPRDARMAGLERIVLRGIAIDAQDPWGTRFSGE